MNGSSKTLKLNSHTEFGSVNHLKLWVPWPRRYGKAFTVKVFTDLKFY